MVCVVCDGLCVFCMTGGFVVCVWCMCCMYDVSLVCFLPVWCMCVVHML